MVREPESGIDVLVVGAGLGGLFGAIELYRQGHNVRVIEIKTQVEGFGTSLLLGSPLSVSLREY
jgi:2-polyprenyl-6-methoxyphenol hydroxylase-like FAD-dependent oxidoreductase